MDTPQNGRRIRPKPMWGQGFQEFVKQFKKYLLENTLKSKLAHQSDSSHLVSEAEPVCSAVDALQSSGPSPYPFPSLQFTVAVSVSLIQPLAGLSILLVGS